MDLRFLLANALTMDEGDTVVIPTLGDKDAESIRTRLYKIREEIPAGSHIIQIQRRTNACGQPEIYLKRTGPPAKIPTIPSPLADKPDIRMIVKRMIEDGKSIEDVMSSLTGLTSQIELFTLYTEESLIFKQLSDNEDYGPEIAGDY